jgi:hypothetical protein
MLAGDYNRVERPDHRLPVFVQVKAGSHQPHGRQQIYLYPLDVGASKLGAGVAASWALGPKIDSQTAALAVAHGSFAAPQAVGASSWTVFTARMAAFAGGYGLRGGTRAGAQTATSSGGVHIRCGQPTHGAAKGAVNGAAIAYEHEGLRGGGSASPVPQGVAGAGGGAPAQQRPPVKGAAAARSETPAEAEAAQAKAKAKAKALTSGSQDRGSQGRASQDSQDRGRDQATASSDPGVERSNSMLGAILGSSIVLAFAGGFALVLSKRRQRKRVSQSPRRRVEAQGCALSQSRRGSISPKQMRALADGGVTVTGVTQRRGSRGKGAGGAAGGGGGGGGEDSGGEDSTGKGKGKGHGKGKGKGKRGLQEEEAETDSAGSDSGQWEAPEEVLERERLEVHGERSLRDSGAEAEAEAAAEAGAGSDADADADADADEAGDEARLLGGA